MLTDKHLVVLAKLRCDARKSLASIGRETGIPTSTLFDYYQELKEEVILRHVAVPDFAKLGYPLRKRFFIRGDDRNALSSFLLEHRNVNVVSRIDHAHAFCEAFFKTQAEVETFKEELKRLKPKEVKEYDVLEELKHEAFTPLAKLKH